MDENQEQSANTDQENNLTSQLVLIRSKAISALSETLQQDHSMDSVTRFNAALSILKYGTDINAAQVALDAAIATETPGIRSDLLTQLVSEVDFLIDSVK